MSETFHVRVSNDRLTFSAGHFITFGDGVCERLHGHNYRVSAEISGPLGENQYVFDFVVLEQTLGAITDELDQHVLLPTGHGSIKVTPGEDQVEVVHDDRRWVFPRGDCILLPVPNTTTELLARHIGRRLLDDLQQRTGARPAVLRVELDESGGRRAGCRLDAE